MPVRASPSAQVFNGFWNGFENPRAGSPTLDQTPAFVDTVTLAFAGPTAESGLSTNFLCRNYPAATIIGWAKQLQARGQRVVMSLLDTPTVHWNQLDLAKFAQTATEVIIGDWGLDGVDVDSESGGASAEVFTELVTELRKALGPRGGGRLLTYDTYLFSPDDQQVLAACKDSLDWVNMMAYFLNYDYMISRFAQYAGLVGPERVAIGVKPGRGTGDQSTPLDEVAQLAAYQPAVGTKRGMMLYALTLDVPFFTDQPAWTWTNTIHDNLSQGAPT
jgi:glycosyl hydrolase family 18 (putative chitinase)